MRDEPLAETLKTVGVPLYAVRDVGWDVIKGAVRSVGTIFLTVLL